MDALDGFAALWRETARKNGLEDFSGEELAAKFSLLYGMLLEANGRVNLTSVTTPGGAAALHFADSLTAAALIPAGARLIDVGCGGGFPSVPLAAAREDLQITALDSTAKKLVCVDGFAAGLGLCNLVTVCARAEELGGDPAYRESFDAAVARAVAPLDILCELCLPFVRVGGSFIAMKSRSAQSELALAADVAAKLGGELSDTREFELYVPGGEGGDPLRTLLVFTKTAPTPRGLPRTFAQIKKDHQRRSGKDK